MNQNSLHSQPMKDQFVDDDCPICRAIQAGRTSLPELRQAFREAEDQGALIGGEWFEEK